MATDCTPLSPLSVRPTELDSHAASCQLLLLLLIPLPLREARYFVRVAHSREMSTIRLELSAYTKVVVVAAVAVAAAAANKHISRATLTDCQRLRLMSFIGSTAPLSRPHF